MLDALRRLGKFSSPADLSAATLSAGAPSISTTHLSIDAWREELPHICQPDHELTNQSGIPDEHFTRKLQPRSPDLQRLALSQNSLLPTHNGNDSDGLHSAMPEIHSLNNQASEPPSLNLLAN